MTDTEPDENANMPVRNSRSAARLGAVQALYQIASTDIPASAVISEFVACRLGQIVDGDQYLSADEELFEDIVGGVSASLDTIDEMISESLRDGLSFDRFERLVKAILRAGSFELIERLDVPTAVVINEYVDVAHAFFDQKEPNLINGVLDKIARKTRGGG